MFWNTLNDFTLTQNGALTRSTSKSALVDMFAMGGSMRTRQDSEIINMFSKALKEDPRLAMKCLFYIRDCRGGLGEKRFFRVATRWLLDNYKNAPKTELIKLMSYYGSWKDVFEVMTSEEYVEFISAVFKRDIMEKTPTLLEKYMPSIGGSSNKEAEKIAKYMEITPKQYRKALSALRAKLGVVEQKMCAKDWNGINYEHVPSKAMLNYTNAFKKHDTNRFDSYIDKVQSGKAKINASVLYPYEIYKRLNERKIQDKEATALWNNLPDYTNGKNAIVMADVSGSMACNGGLPMAVSVSLALYFAERNKGKFHGSFMTFSGNPSVEQVKGSTLEQKMNNISRANWGMNTDLIKAFETILSICVSERVPQEEMPETIYVISDMEFDVATSNNGWRYRENNHTIPEMSVTNYTAIKDRYTSAGYTIPKIVFWNVNSRQNNLPVSKDELNTVLVSGSSPSVFKLAVSEGCSPESFMLDAINGERYAPVDRLFA